jgi:hypothetical protein
MVTRAPCHAAIAIRTPPAAVARRSAADVIGSGIRLHVPIWESIHPELQRAHHRVVSGRVPTPRPGAGATQCIRLGKTWDLISELEIIENLLDVRGEAIRIGGKVTPTWARNMMLTGCAIPVGLVTAWH